MPDRFKGQGSYFNRYDWEDLLGYGIDDRAYNAFYRLRLKFVSAVEMSDADLLVKKRIGPKLLMSFTSSLVSLAQDKGIPLPTPNDTIMPEEWDGLGSA